MRKGHPSRVAVLAALALCLGVALPLRITGIAFGSDLVHARPDEVGVVDTLRGLRARKIHPMLLAYGGGYHVPLYAFVRGVEVSRHEEALATRGWEAFHRLKVEARWWSALLSTLAVWLTFVAGRRYGGDSAGLLAALLLAVAVLPVREAHFAKADSAAACASALVLVMVLPSARRGPRAAAALAGALAWAVSLKYQVGVLPAGALALWRLVRDDESGWDRRALGAAAATGAAVLLVANAHWVLAPRTSWLFLEVIRKSQIDYPRLPFWAGQAPGPFVYHALVSLPYGAGIAVAALALPAALWALRSRVGRLVVVLMAGQAAVLLQNDLVVARNALPLFPPLAVLVAGLVTGVAVRLPPRVRRWVVAGVALALVAEPLGHDARLLRALVAQDTRSAAAAWIASHLPGDARIVRWGAPPGATPYGAPETGGRPTADGAPPERWRALGATHLVWDAYPSPFSSVGLSSELRARLRSLAVFDPFVGAERDVVLEPHDAFYLPLGGLDRVERPGPRIEIFAIADAAGRVRPSE